MKLWSDVIAENLSYDKAKQWIEKFDTYGFITRPSYHDFHMMSKGKYYIVHGNCDITINPQTVQHTDKDDWMIVNIRPLARDLLIARKLHAGYAYSKQEKENLKDRFENTIIRDESKGRRK